MPDAAVPIREEQYQRRGQLLVLKTRLANKDHYIACIANVAESATYGNTRAADRRGWFKSLVAGAAARRPRDNMAVCMCVME